MKKPQKIKRRNFLMALGGLAGLTFFSGARPEDAGAIPPKTLKVDENSQSKYHLTRHIRKYYRKARI